MFHRAAQQNHAFAELTLGYMYYYGHGAKKNYKKSMKWFRKAADQGNTRAQHNIGIMYLNGFGVPQCYATSARYLRKAINNNIDVADITKKCLEKLYQNGSVSRPHNYSLETAYTKATCSICQENEPVYYWPCKQPHPNDYCACKECIQLVTHCAYCRQSLQQSRS